MLIVDAQVHIWSNAIPTNAAHRQIPTYTTVDLLRDMDDSGINATVIHPPGWDPNSSELALDAANQHPDRLSILGKFALDDPDSRTLVADWKQQPGMMGLRFALQTPEQQAWLTDGSMEWLWPAAAAAGLPIALFGPDFLTALDDIARRHPETRLIVDHMGRPPAASGIRGAEAWTNLPNLIALAKHPNVAVKATGAPSYSAGPYPFLDIHDHLRRIYDAFGPDRMFWGTDITRMSCSWTQCVTLFTEELPWLSEHDKELVMGRALCNWLGWDLPE